MSRCLHEWISKCHYWERALWGRTWSDRELAAEERLLRSDREVLEAKQVERLRVLLAHAERHVPYYRKLLGEAGVHADDVHSLDVLARIPILDKPKIRAAGDGMLAEGVDRSRLRKNASGGSTGEPLQFFQDERFVNETTRAVLALNQWTGWRRGERVALLWGARNDNARFDREWVRNWLQNRFLIDAFDMGEARLARAVERLRQGRPKLILAYASAAYLVARYMEREGISLEHPPKAAISSAEVLLPHYRRTIEARFRCKVFDRYGSREVGPMAMQCEAGAMHVNAGHVILEVENPDETGVGNLIVTQLDNFAFPFIRYRIGDLAAVDRSSGCPCGRSAPVLRDLRGRMSDYIIAPDGKLIHGEWFTHLFYGMPGVTLFTFRQTGPAEYKFEVKREAGFSDAAMNEAVGRAQTKLGPSARIETIFVDKLESTVTGKHRFVINEYMNPSEAMVKDG